MKDVNKWQYDFMLEVFGLFLSIKGRLNFMQLSRYGDHGEQHYRNQFSNSCYASKPQKRMIKQL